MEMEIWRNVQPESFADIHKQLGCRRREILDVDTCGAEPLSFSQIGKAHLGQQSRLSFWIYTDELYGWAEK